MNKMSHKFFLLLFPLFITGLLLSLTQQAGAIGVPFIRWKVNLVLLEKVPTVELTVQRWTNLGGGQRELDDEKIFQLTCQTTGNPQFMNGEVTFDGSSYFSCDMPSIQTIAWDEWGLSIPDACSAKQPYINGYAAIEGNPSDTFPENPIFYRDDIQFNMPLDVKTQNAVLDASFGSVTAQSQAFNTNSLGHLFSASFARSGNIFSPSFMVDGVSLNAFPATVNPPAVISNLESTIFFGYSPQTGEYFQGTLGETEIDPVCPTTG